MEQRPDRFTAILDANVLAGGLIRNTLLHLAAAGFYRPRWSRRILREMEGAIRKRKPDDAYIRNLLNRMDRAFGDEAIVDGWEVYEPAVSLPDPNDRHVVAAAIRCDAAVIVTENLKDFPPERLAPFGIEALSADHFLASTIDLNQEAAVNRIRRMREGFMRPEITAARLVERYAELGLRDTAALLGGLVGDL